MICTVISIEILQRSAAQNSSSRLAGLLIWQKNKEEKEFHDSWFIIKRCGGGKGMISKIIYNYSWKSNKVQTAEKGPVGGGERKAITWGGELVPQYSRTVCYSKCSNRQDCGSRRRGKTTFCYKPCSSITFKKATNWADQNGGWMNDWSEDEKQRNELSRFQKPVWKKNVFVVYVSKLSTKSVSLPDSDHVQYFLIWVSCSFIYKCFGKKPFDFHSAEPVT